MSGWSDEQVNELCARLRDGRFTAEDTPDVTVLEALTDEQRKRVVAACEVRERANVRAAVFGAVAALQGRGEATPGFPVFVFVDDVPDSPEGLLESE